jgi:hypothetical protein
MLELSDDDLVSRTHRAPKRSRQVIDHGRRVWTKDDFIRGSIQKIRERVPRGFDNRVGFVAGGIFPMRIRVVIQQVIRDRIDDRTRRLGAARSVKVRDGMIIVTALEGRKLIPDIFG